MTELVELGKVVQGFLEWEWQQLITICIVSCLLLRITADITFNLNKRLTKRQEKCRELCRHYVFALQIKVHSHDRRL